MCVCVCYLLLWLWFTTSHLCGGRGAGRGDGGGSRCQRHCDRGNGETEHVLQCVYVLDVVEGELGCKPSTTRKDWDRRVRRGFGCRSVDAVDEVTCQGVCGVKEAGQGRE